MAEIQNSALSDNDANVQDLFYKFVYVRDSLKEEIGKIDPKITKLEETTKLFVAHFDDFKTLSTKAEITLKQSILNASSEMAENASKEIEKRLNSKVDGVMDNLKQSAFQTHLTLREARSQITWRNVIILGVCILVSVLVSVASCYLLSKKLDYFVSEAGQRTISSGLFLEKVWPKLSDKERAKMIRLEKS